jgi:hypothetical protein
MIPALVPLAILVSGSTAALSGSVSVAISPSASLTVGGTAPLSGTVGLSFFVGNLPISSAGVFDSSGRLVRNLWSAKRNDPRISNPAAAWDGTVDTFPPGGLEIAPTGTYTIKVLRHNMRYQWDGTVGNTSPNHVDNMFYHNEGTAICDMEITDSGDMYYCTLYNERWPCCHVTTTANPQVMNYPVLIGSRTTYASQSACCTDGTLAYFNYTPPGSTSVAIYGIKVADRTIWPFAFGTVYGEFNFAIGINHTNRDITSLAVQKSGSYLFASAATLDSLKVYNKTTGEELHSLVGTYNAIGALATNPVTGDLWAVYSPGGVLANTIIKLSVDGAGNPTPSGVSITVVNGSIISLAVSPDGSTLLAVDNGVAQQVRAFNTSDGSVKTVWGTSGTLGSNGGYASTPVVTNTRFMFKCMSHFGGTDGYVAYAPDGSFWLGDSGNERSLHFSSGNSPTYIEQIAFNGGFYSCQVDWSDHTRVTVNFLEFQIDYDFDEITPTNGSWTLLNNWGFLFANDPNNTYTRLEFIGTYSNGRRYASVYDVGLGQNRIWELTSTGTRDTGVTFPRGQYIDADFNRNDLYHVGTGIGTWRVKLDQVAFAGFDGSHNPSWGATTNLMTSVLLDFGKFPVPQTDPNFRVPTEGTSNGVIPVVHTFGDTPGIGNDCGRCGGLDLTTGAIRYDTWPQSPRLPNQLTLTWPEAPFFSCATTLGGGPHFYIPHDNNFFTSYRGEEWGNNQTAMFYHWHESGLLLDMFGVAAPYFAAESLMFPRGHTIIPAIGAPTVGVPNRIMSFKGMAGLSGNFAWGGLGKVNGVYYIYVSDEWYHGLQRWSCRGIETVVQTSTIVNWVSGSYVPFSDPTDMLEGLPYASTNVPNLSGGWTRNPTTNSGPGHPLWQITTNDIICDPHRSPDLTVIFSAVNVSNFTISKPIPRVGSGNWTIDSRVYLVNGFRDSLGHSDNTELFIDVVDNTGKVIVRLVSYFSFQEGDAGGLRVNNVKISTETGFIQDWRTLSGAERSLVIKYISSTGKIQVIYDGGTAQTLDAGVLEVGAAPGSPATFRLLGQAGATGGGVSPVVSLTKLNYTEV